jgi:hypothetical protein
MVSWKGGHGLTSRMTDYDKRFHAADTEERRTQRITIGVGGNSATDQGELDRVGKGVQ